jgi:hypothetical protein
VKASLLYRVASGLLVLFAAGHALGFQQADPAWGVGAVLEAMQSSHFVVEGFTRTYWDFFLGTGFVVAVFYLFAAVVAWQLGGLPKVTLASMRVTAWSFALGFAAVTAISWRFLFWIPIVFSAAVTACLIAAAWCSGADAAASAPQKLGDPRRRSI